MTQESLYEVGPLPAVVTFGSPKEQLTTVRTDRLVECYTIWLATVIAVVVLVLLLRAADGRRRRRRFERFHHLGSASSLGLRLSPSSSVGARGRGGTS